MEPIDEDTDSSVDPNPEPADGDTEPDSGDSDQVDDSGHIP